ncbi:protease HtpX [Solemya elarraichensis gill symbiont]|uniref:Protease HtpX n=1 Tax=Solemya elarraichensis gill symbiont TaxID=1918949 RepID=A0A1T2L276_9GAMM|nr:protease HtpX [Solemya elarraichensis gill symbiont]OOZ39182.1 zinc metalloprotease HtpX [Solemya elarraichensis gill symbiont]
MLRIFLFLATNFAVLLLVGIIFQLLGIEGILQENGVDMNLQALLVLSVVIGFGGSFFSLFMSKWLAKRSMGVQVIETPNGQAEQWLVDTVTRQAQQAGIGMPEVGIFDSPAPNAFATGANRNNSLVAVSAGLLENMNRNEVEAVLAHEVSHVANGDMVTLTLIQGIVNSFVIFFSRVVGHLVDRVIFKTERGYGPGYYIGSIVAQIIFSLLASMIVMWFSRRREFRADAGGAALAGRHNMIAALRRLQTAHDPQPLPDEMAAFGISGKVKSLFSSHPPLDERIITLENSTQ